MKSELQLIDEGLTRAVNRARRKFLVRQLGKCGITETDVSLEELEDLYQELREEEKNGIQKTVNDEDSGNEQR